MSVVLHPQMTASKSVPMAQATTHAAAMKASDSTLTGELVRVHEEATNFAWQHLFCSFLSFQE